MKKKILALTMCVVMLAVAVTGATLAYFTDEDKAANTFELGGVDITLIEKAYKDSKWEEIENPDGQATLGQLAPIDKDNWNDITAAGYAYNKTVFTMNNEDTAYIRNYVAVESIADQTVDPEDEEIYHIWYLDADATADKASEVKKMRHGSALTEKFANVDIDGVMYDIYVFDTVGNTPVETGDSFVTLTTVTLNKWVTNEMVALLGDKFEIYTWSEAIQETGLTHEEAMAALIGEDSNLKTHAINQLKEVMSANDDSNDTTTNP